MSQAAIQLLLPSHDILDRYAAALSRGWSPSTTEDVSMAQLAEIAADADAFITRLSRRDGWLERLADGGTKRWLPQRVFWIWDGDVCGSINFRYVEGTEELPPNVSGHVGYSIVPWKQRRGIGTRALAMILPVAREHGMSGVVVTCDTDNDGSRKVIVANGGVFQGEATGPNGAGTKLVYRIAL